MGALAFAAGAFIEFEPYLGKWMDAITIYVVPFGALLCAFIIYWVLGGKRIGEELVLGRKKALCRGVPAHGAVPLRRAGRVGIHFKHHLRRHRLSRF